MAVIDLVFGGGVAGLQRRDDVVQLRIVETGGSHYACGTVRQRCGQRTGAGEALVRRVVDAEADGEVAAVEQVRRLLRPLGHEHRPQAPFADPGADALAAGVVVLGVAVVVHHQVGRGIEGGRVQHRGGRQHHGVHVLQRASARQLFM